MPPPHWFALPAHANIAVPASLLAERDDLCRKRDAAREDLSRAKHELDELKRGKKFRLL